ncbi:MAG TPA: GNAT family N-acetyltransferase [Anaerolineae bacterium]
MRIFQSIQVQNRKQLARFCAPAGLPLLEVETVARHNADAHWMLKNRDGDVVARCSLWWQRTPLYGDHRLGLIGHYAAHDAEAASQLLDLACDRLAAQGCTMAVGPMDGSTWQRYRLLTERGNEPGFFLEPDNPDEWPAHFTGNGFTVLATYVSALVTDLNRPEPRLARVAERATVRGIRIRPLNLERFEAELRCLYRLALAGFEQNLLFTPIDESEFMALYRPLRPSIRPELSLIAERHGRPVGFVFALPDWLQAPRGESIDTVIIKTVAVHPDHRSGGLGSLLVARCHEIAHSLGYRRTIHALMHETNDSRKIGRRNEARVMRRYALFAKRI